MAYDIYIGNAIIETDDEFNDINVIVKSVDHDDAPTFPNDTFTGNENHRHPGYSAFDGWAHTVGLHDLFYDEDTGLMRDHPGTFRITRDDLARVESARKQWQQQHPDTTPGFESFDTAMGRADAVGYDSSLARLLWFEWWMRWALRNCKIPAIHNH